MMDTLDLAALIQRKNEYTAFLRNEADRIACCLYALGVQQVILFGSVASGNARLHSDIDLAVIWETPLCQPDRTVTLYQRLGTLPVPVDLVVLTPTEAISAHQTQFTKKIFAQGVPL